MKKSIAIVIVILAAVVLITGCDPNKAKREAARKQWVMTPEQGKKEAQAYQDMMAEINQYKADMGEYPATLEELQAAGYTIHPRAEGPNGGWSYSLMQGVPRLTPALPQLPGQEQEQQPNGQ